MPRSPNLDGRAISSVIRTINRLPAPITWERVVEAFATETGITYSRQAFDKHEPVRAAFWARKSGSPCTGRPRSAAEEARRALRAENDALKGQVATLLEQLAAVAHNAYVENISRDLLFRPLPPADRAGGRRPVRRRLPCRVNGRRRPPARPG